MGALALARPSAVLLDLDGTLVDSEPAHRASWQAFFAARGWSVDEETYATEFVGRRGADVFRELPGPWSTEDPDALVEEVLGHLPRFAAEAVAVTGAVQLLGDLRERGVPVAVVTSATRGWADLALGDLLGAAHLIDALVTAEDVAAGKPDPEGYRLAASRLAVDPADAVAVEDAPAGVRAARDAGVGIVVAVRATTTEAALRDAGAHHVVRDLRSVTFVT